MQSSVLFFGQLGSTQQAVSEAIEECQITRTESDPKLVNIMYVRLCTDTLL